jgi:hypothetical protein
MEVFLPNRHNGVFQTNDLDVSHPWLRKRPVAVTVTVIHLELGNIFNNIYILRWIYSTESCRNVFFLIYYIYGVIYYTIAWPHGNMTNICICIYIYIHLRYSLHTQKCWQGYGWEQKPLLFGDDSSGDLGENYVPGKAVEKWLEMRMKHGMERWRHENPRRIRDSWLKQSSFQFDYTSGTFRCGFEEDLFPGRILENKWIYQKSLTGLPSLWKSRSSDNPGRKSRWAYGNEFYRIAP